MRLVFMGTPAFAVPVLRALTAAPNVHLAGVYTQPDRPMGRGRRLEMPPVKSHALVQGLPVHQPDSLRPEEVQRDLAAMKPDVIVVAAYGKLLPPGVLSIPPHGCLNVHPSLLPRYRGPSPVSTAILEGAPVTGVTLMLLDHGMDTGPIVSQTEYKMSGRETAETLTAGLFQLGAELLLRCLEPWVSGRITPRLQDDTKATTTRKLERADGQADWRLPATALERRRRAFTPWPGLFTFWEGKVLKLLDVEPWPPSDPTPARPGQVVRLPSETTPLGVGAVDGILGLKTVQLEGRRALPAGEFLRGYPRFLGARL